mgnify:CR=1 FL=1
MIQNRIDSYVEEYREEAISFLTEMLQTPSPTGKELEVSKVAERWMRADGLEVERHYLKPERPNLISHWKGTEDGPRFIFNGHYDVFPPTSEEENPWSGEIKDGNIYGRGSADMKAGLTAGMMAVKLLKRIGFEPKGEIMISCDCDEEQGGVYGAKYLISQGLLKADFGICMEASEDLVIVESDGRIEYKITYRADGWHAGMRENRDDALKKAVRAIERLYKYDEMLLKERYYGAREGGAILSVTKIQSGEESNIHPSSCIVFLDRRYTKGETVESATEELREVLDELKQEDPEMEYELEIPIASPQLSMEVDHPCIRAAMESYKAVFGKEIVPGRRCGGGDTAKITSAYGYPLPQFGPGRFDQLCVPEEHVSIDEYINFIKVYMHMVVDLLGK